MRPRVVHIRIAIESEEERTALRGALLAARASELAQARRRGARLGFGYGTDGARETMSDEVELAERRRTMLDRLIEALDVAVAADDPEAPVG
jgi:hypothetical protein